MLRTVFLFALLFLSSCAKDPDYIKEHSLEYLYNKGYTSFKKGSYQLAIDYFQAVDLQHPYSAYAPKALIMSIFCKYLDREFEEVIEARDTFLATNPGYKHADYVEFMAIRACLELMMSYKRDQSPTEVAIKLCRDFKQKYPRSKYLPYIKTINIQVLTNLQAHKMMNARTYQEIGLHLAALKVLHEVHKHYSYNPVYEPEKLYRMCTSYLALQLDDLALKANNLLQKNYANSKWARLANTLYDKRFKVGYVIKKNKNS